jgi:hypothetical protein
VISPDVVPAAPPRAAGTRALRVLVVLVGGLTALGLPVGVLWWLVAPIAQLRIQKDGGFFVDPQPQQFIASDAWFILLTGVVGLAAGLLTWWLAGSSGYSAVLGLALGGTAGAALAWGVGAWLGRVDLAAAAKLPVGSLVDVPLRLGMHGALVVEPLLALFAWVVPDLLFPSGPVSRADRSGPASLG